MAIQKNDANKKILKLYIRKVYFIIFYNFALNISICKEFKNSKEFSRDIKIKTI